MSGRRDNHSEGEPRRIVHIGPGDAEPRPGAPLDDQPSYLIEEARERVRQDDDRNREVSLVAKRLVVAFVLVAVLAVVFHIVMPAFGLRLPPVVPLLCYAAIAFGAIMTARDA